MQFLIILILGLMALWIAFMALWAVIVFLLRLLGWAVAALVLLFGVGFVVGLVWGAVLPIRVFGGRLATHRPEIATPEKVHDGQVIRRAPRGDTEHYGWDQAWPNYVPYQLRRDVKACTSAVRGGTDHAFGRYWVVVGLPVLGYRLGAWTAYVLWRVIAEVLATVVTAVQALRSRRLALRDRRDLRKKQAGLRCIHCYRETMTPSFACPNPACDIIHRDISPGPLGITERICGCDALVPLTVHAAALTLTTVCPYCNEAQPTGTGARRVVVIPVFGSVGVGKTQFLSSAARGLSQLAGEQGGSLSPASAAAGAFLTTAGALAETGQHPVKTINSAKPQGLPYVLERPGEPAIEFQLLDAAGERFVRSEDTRSLGYLDTANVLVFLFDPLTLGEVEGQLQTAGLATQVQVAQGAMSDSYGSVVDRLRDDGMDLRRTSLAFVVTKADIVRRVMPGSAIPSEDRQIRDWLHDNDADNLVRRVEKDFTTCRYFAVDSFGTDDISAPDHPLQVLDWSAGGGLSPGRSAPASHDVAGMPT